jgi:two-component system, LytTR family, sensor kinase
MDRQPVPVTQPDRLRKTANWSGAKGWGLAACFWIVIVLLSSLKREGPVIRGQEIPWIDSLIISIEVWGAWALLTPVIIWTDRRLPVRRDALLQRLLLHIPLSFVFITAYIYTARALTILLTGTSDDSWFTGGVIDVATRAVGRTSNMIYWVIVGVSTSFEYQREMRQNEVNRAILERYVSEARLRLLLVQLHPHFLFNTLNTIAATIDTSTERAQFLLERLGDLLRLSMEHINLDEVPLDKELSFIGCYSDLQRARFGDSLDISITSTDDMNEALVPAFILQPIVENAIRYGPLAVAKKGTIELSAERTDGRLCLTVHDSGPGFPSDWSFERKGGIGLTNTRERLRLLYGDDKFSFRAFNPDGGGASVEIVLPLRTAARTP